MLASDVSSIKLRGGEKGNDASRQASRKSLLSTASGVNIVSESTLSDDIKVIEETSNFLGQHAPGIKLPPENIKIFYLKYSIYIIARAGKIYALAACGKIGDCG